MSIKDTRRGILFYRVSLPIYEPYKKLDSPIVRCAAKRIRIDSVSLLNLEFLQENGSDLLSHSYELPFSKKNIEKKLAELFEEFSLL
jgi:hypothetical protein